jgi:drug/metabolite transporter (DMT)-like permease
MLILIVILNYAILASTFTLGATTVKYTHFLNVLTLRMLLSSIIILGFYKLRYKKNLSQLFFENWKSLIALSFFYIYVTFALEFYALNYVSSGKVALIYSTTPFFSAIMAYFMNGKRISARGLFSLALGFLGIVVSVIPPELQKTTYLIPKSAFSSASFLFVSVPELAIILATISATYSWFNIKKLLDKGFDVIFINGISMFFGGIMLLLTTLTYGFTLDTPATHFSVTSTDVFYFIAMSILAANIIFFNLQTWLMKFFDITFLMLCGLLTPLFAVLFGWYFLNENINSYTIVALLFVITALVLYYRETKQNPKNTT